VVLDVKGLQTYSDEGVVKAVDGLTYQVRKGEFVGLVGESGGGKSVSAMSVVRLIPYPPRVIAGGLSRGCCEEEHGRPRPTVPSAVR